jgi:hypothetical protein
MLLAGYDPQYVAEFIVRFESRLDPGVVVVGR